MSARLEGYGRLIDRSKRVSFSFNGKRFRGYGGDTLASALLGAGQMMLGRSFKYHRPRGLVASGAEEPNALVGLGEGGRFEPDQRATTTELFDGLAAISQNHWPSLAFDIGEANNYVARFLPAGFYYKTFMAPRGAWAKIFEPFVRQSAGLGRVPVDADADSYEYVYAHYDVVVVGGGVAGLQAARAAAATGVSVLVMEDAAHWGGRAPVDGGEIDGMAPGDWVKAVLEELENADNVTLRLRMQGTGVYDHGYLLGYERVADHSPGDGRPRHRLWRIRAGRIVTATGALERPLAFAGNDVPGVMLASAMRDYLVNWGVAAGRRIVVVTNNDDAYRTALAMKAAGRVVAAVLDAREVVTSPLAQAARAAGIPVMEGRAIAEVRGRARVNRQGRRGDPVRRGGDVGRLVAGGAPVVALRRQAHLGRGGGAVPPRPGARAHGGRRCALRADGGGGLGRAGARCLPRRCPRGREGCGQGGGWQGQPQGGAEGVVRGRGRDRAGLDHARGRGPREAHEDVARLPERREGVGRSACGARGLRERRAHQALYHAGDGDGSRQA